MEYNWENLSLADLVALKDYTENHGEMFMRGINNHNNKTKLMDDLSYKFHNERAAYWLSIYGECNERLEAACKHLSQTVESNKVN